MILIDTTPLVALCDNRDRLHARAVKDLTSLAHEEFALCEAVLTEACFHLSHQSQRQRRRMRMLLDELDARPYVSTPAPEFRFEAFAWLEKYGEHEPDWADACMAVVCGHDRTLRVWTYDREFKTTWRRPNGTMIPLAARLA